MVVDFHQLAKFGTFEGLIGHYAPASTGAKHYHRFKAAKAGFLFSR